MKRGGVLMTGLLAGLLVLAGCGDRPGYDASAVEKYLVGSQAWRFGGTGDVTKASCPSDRDLSEGMKVRCTLTVSGAKVPFVVTLNDVQATKMKVTAKPDGVIIPGERLTEVVGLALPEDARKAKVDCGGGAFLVAKVGQSVDCTLRLGSQTKTFKVTVKDDSGRIAVAS